MRITLEAFGDEILTREILRVRSHADDMRPAFDAVHDVFLATEAAQFNSQGGSEPWKPLAASTVAYKRRHNLDPRILHATLRLRNSLASRTGADHLYRTTKDEMVVGSTVPYGIFHQSTRPRSRLPRRPPVNLSEMTKRLWVKILQDYLMTGLIRPGTIR